MTSEQAIRESGEDPDVCTCVRCDLCDGEGAIVTEWISYPGENNRGPNCATREPVEVSTCPRCHGTAMDKTECELHYMEVPA
jgi:hypothetical protein